MDSEFIITLVKTKIKDSQKKLILITVKIGECFICPDIIIDHTTKSFEINWSEINIASLTKEQFCILECLLDMESDMKNIIFSLLKEKNFF